LIEAYRFAVTGDLLRNADLVHPTEADPIPPRVQPVTKDHRLYD